MQPCQFRLDDVRRAARTDGAPPPAEAAALVAVFDEAAGARVVLIRRAIALPRNPGEIAFPGGHVDSGESMVDAALREAQEEVGLAPSDVEVVGWLDRVSVSTSGATVTPVVGVLAGGRPALVPSPDEVEAVFDVGLAELAACYREERWDVPTPDRAMHFFDLGEDLVWGMTARVLYELLCALTARTVQPARAQAPARAGRTPPGSV